MSDVAIEARNLSYQYPDGTSALTEVSFRIARGESVALVGANGAGKSSLLLQLNGCLSPSTGELSIAGLATSKENLPAIRRAVGMVFQDSDDQLFMPTVFDDVAFGPINLGVHPDDLESRVIQAMRRVGAEHLRQRPPYRLSGGEKRAVAIATVLAMEPDILVLDEPTAGLDPAGRRRLLGLLRSFNQTKILATHDLDLAMDLCERILILHQGRIVADGQTDRILRDEALLESCHLEIPLRLQACPICCVSAVRSAGD